MKPVTLLAFWPLVALLLVLVAVLALASAESGPASAQNDSSAEKPAKPTGLKVTTERGSLDMNSLSHKITGLTAGTEYTVRVAAVNRLGPTDFIDNHGHSRAAETTGNSG